MTAASDHAAALAALADRLAKVAAGTAGPWGGPEDAFGGRSGALELHRVFSEPTRATGEFADEVADCLDQPDAALIVQMRNDYEPLLRLAQTVLERHAPYAEFGLCRGCDGFCSIGCEGESPWPCPDAQAALDAIGDHRG